MLDKKNQLKCRIKCIEPCSVMQLSLSLEKPKDQKQNKSCNTSRNTKINIMRITLCPCYTILQSTFLNFFSTLVQMFT